MKNFPAKVMRRTSEASGANDNKPLAESPMEIIKGADFLAEEPNER